MRIQAFETSSLLTLLYAGSHLQHEDFFGSLLGRLCEANVGLRKSRKNDQKSEQLDDIQTKTDYSNKWVPELLRPGVKDRL